jgi:outer membrane protein TolC
MKRAHTHTYSIKIKRNLTATFYFVFIVALFSGFQAQAGTYNLKTFLSRVESHSKDLKLARKERDMAKVYKKEALSTALPKIMIEATYNRNLKANYLFIDFPDFETGEMTNQKFKINYKNEYGLNAVLNQTLFSFKVGNALRAAREFKKLTNFVYDAAHQSIVKMAKKAFYQTLLLKKVWEVSRASEENAHENYLNMKKKYDNGQVSEFKLLQAEARWQSQVPGTTQAKRNYELALNSLKNLTGIPVEEEMVLDGDFDHIPAMPVIPPVDTVLEKRPDFNALLWEARLRGTGVKSEAADRLPSLNLSLVYNFSSLSDYFKLERQNKSYIVGLNLSFPIFTGGYTRAQVQKAKIELEKTRIKIEKEKETIYNDIHNIWLRMEEARKRIQSASKSLETAKKAFKIAEITAANGLATQLELKDARVIYDQAILNGYAATYDYLDAYFDWEQATGSM